MTSVFSVPFRLKINICMNQHLKMRSNSFGSFKIYYGFFCIAELGINPDHILQKVRKVYFLLFSCCFMYGGHTSRNLSLPYPLAYWARSFRIHLCECVWWQQNDGNPPSSNRPCFSLASVGHRRVAKIWENFRN